MICRWLALTALLLPALAQAKPCADVDDAVELNRCLHAEVERAEDELDRYLQASRERHGKMADAMVSMEAAHGAWMRFRDSHCLAEFDLWADGSIRTTILAQCLLRQTQRRTHEIWQVYLAPTDAAPVLPEPQLP
ncbi:lysozyme inhibitor LprI family protein [Pseudomonas sp.]|uniref:lysozyme inhibitor LprI family protein n=1 Tax=Pseudomonas sp. TaxID=306 RepID=UPI002729821A|nr:lysozyme inhibitor LprI family protein [Pseudomonas sp.]